MELKLRAYDNIHKDIKEVEHINFNRRTCYLWKVEKDSRYTVARDFEDVEFMWSSGVHDDTKQETEIFDKDILEVEYKDDKYIVRVEYGQGSYVLVSDELPEGYITFPDISESDRDYEWIPNSKVIGNRYSNLPLWLRLVS